MTEPTERRRVLMTGAGLALLAVVPSLRAQGRGMTAMSAVPPAPTLRLADADGRSVDLAAYRGRVVLVNFWATWCPPCRKEFPSLARVKKLFKPAEFEVLAVNVGEDPDTVFSFAGNAEFPLLFDRDSKAMAAWPVKGLPTTLLVDRQGRIAYRAVGGREFDDPDIVAAIRQLLKP
ncbi:MAG: TlpA family protein disulfide reductase [Gammaproteobacteria bacterium]|nr:TlpA family protein disulfide reductase [Gammaproteobacteria bacterium]MBU1645458.1 TlpA family protein disulfide reductase [Gammaproteobacteria bacterium]MBU1971081.1 TlpA family protein disulfide reductase [Gammaproteobacteria bacterium]